MVIKMVKILISGGPVHAYLDAVKLLTNKFKGGRMLSLANKLSDCGADVTYLTTKLTKINSVNAVYHDGYHDYRRLVRELAPQNDAVILGAAVANLVPVAPWSGKFPSHQHKIGDVFSVPMTVAPRIIDEVKRDQVDMFPYNPLFPSDHKETLLASNPNCHLFGYKLLSGVSVDELVEAAYNIVLASGATAVFANDANNLDQKYAVTKERAVIPLMENDLPRFILQCLDDVYYKSIIYPDDLASYDQDIEAAKDLISRHSDKFKTTQGGYVFGTVAVRTGVSSFITTARGKRELDDWTLVRAVDHEKHEVYASPKRATLNAPLLSHIFQCFPDVMSVVHYHECPKDSTYKVYPWAPPGTVRDSVRKLDGGNFVIDHHGVYILYR